VAFAISRDGCLTRTRGRATIISGPESQRLTHQLRARHDALLVGVGTVLSDDPALTTRLVEGPSPLRVVLDSQLRVPTTAKLLRSTSRPAWLVTREPADAARARALAAAGAQLIQVPAADSGSTGTNGSMTGHDGHDGHEGSEGGGSPIGPGVSSGGNMRGSGGTSNGSDMSAGAGGSSGGNMRGSGGMNSDSDMSTRAGVRSRSSRRVSRGSDISTGGVRSRTTGGMNSSSDMSTGAGASSRSSVAPTPDGVCIPSLLSLLLASGVRTLMVEGGSAVLESFFRANAVDYVALTVSRRRLSNPCAVRLGACTKAVLDAWRARAPTIRVGEDLLAAGPLALPELDPSLMNTSHRLAAP
jgi:riboflavin biosynthesis pyrimidine reductase